MALRVLAGFCGGGFMELENGKIEKQLEELTEKMYGRTIAACTDVQLYHCVLQMTRLLLADTPLITGKKKVYYFSMEFLIGKLMSNNLINLGVYEEVDAVLKKNAKSLSVIEEAEPEPSLGNGGLGRLAACFLDSMATLGIPGDGIGLNYHFGLFRQVFRDRLQRAEKNEWMEEDSWLRDTGITFEVAFGNRKVMAVLYDIDVIGYENDRNRLHLFDVATVDEELVREGISFDKTAIEKNLTLFLYPDDSDEAGNLLRIYQEYFMCSSGAQLMVRELKEKGCDLHRMEEYAAVQINDTHPTFVIPELIRILTWEEGFTIEDAVNVVSKTCAYTNHTILAEALEKWPLSYIERVVPQLVPIIRELSARVAKKYPDPEVQIIDRENRVHMAHIAIHYGYSVNGVAAIHTEILKESELNSFYRIYPEKFNNKTNGITFRRWLLCCNRELSRVLTDTIGNGYRKNAYELEKLLEKKEDPLVLDALEGVKRQKKEELAAFLQEKEGISLDTNAVFDIQVKRLHEYKRQQMNALYIIHQYLEIKAGRRPVRPRAYIFGAKAAPAYVIAQDIIHLLLVLSEIVNHDPEVSPYMKVVMVENYNVSYAEKLIPACDISEQISLASKEASGTGNMKFMLNGAVTLGTRDGANVEIRQLVGADNIYMFGKDSDTVIAHYAKGDYVPRNYYEGSSVIQEAVDFLVSDRALRVGHEANLRRLHGELLNKDWFMTLLDLEEYIAVKDKMFADYEDRLKWKKMMLVNIAKAGYFSSDRTIAEYNREIWKLSQ